jgi:hypothetical protein
MRSLTARSFFTPARKAIDSRPRQTRNEQETSRERRRGLYETGFRNQINSGEVVIVFPLQAEPNRGKMSRRPPSEV